MAFKPLTSSRSALAETPKPVENLATPSSPSELIANTEERIYIIYDDSGSMSTEVYDGAKLLGSRQTLAAEATIEYMRNCKPRVSAIEIAPLNKETLDITKNLPALAVKLRAVDAAGGTRLFGAVEKLITKHPLYQYTRALIFTDGEATDYPGPDFEARVLALGIPIDVILISDYTTLTNLSSSNEQFKRVAEKSGGTFMICKDGKSFKDKMKYFAPLLRHQLPAIASQGDN
jgi:hypothetical protein